MTRILAAIIAASLIGAATAAAQSPAPQQSINKRVDALEKKTDYYNKKNKTLNIHRQKGKAARISGGTVTCEGSGGEARLIAKLDPQVSYGGTAYAWLTLRAKFSSDVGMMIVTWRMEGNLASSCYVENNKPDSPGVFSWKRFCSFEFQRGEAHLIRIDALSKSGENVSACTSNLELDMELKLTNIEVVEPE